MASSGTVSSPVKDGRRVLGDKTTNASWTPAKDHFNPSKHLVDNRVSSTDVPDSPKKPFSPSQKAGRKRTIDELEDPGNKLSTSQSLPKWTVPPTQDKFRIFEDSGITLNEYCSQVCQQRTMFLLNFLFCLRRFPHVCNMHSHDCTLKGSHISNRIRISYIMWRRTRFG